MSQVLGIHGIAKQQLGRHALLRDWEDAVADGLERFARACTDKPSVDMAFYGDVFLPKETRRGEKSGVDDDWLLADLAEDELSDVAELMAESVPEAVLAAAEHEHPKGYSRMPRPLQVAMRAVDRHFGPAAGLLHIGEFRQVRRYLRSPELRTVVDQRVSAGLTAETKVVIGHSLGSVVAFDYLRRHPEHGVVLLTLGSPLGLRMVRQRLTDWQAGPGQVTRWTNVRDPHDPVACAGDLSRLWPALVDVRVDNQGDAHSALRYLSKAEAGRAVGEALGISARESAS